ncbi:SMODS-associated NUDIX domain-containing protein [Streptomyces laurentii]|uniref:SMODS-associated NUDIX domain-containing protein n=1 Tax=Streptomyces laurentii TaxID=39478 RepID=UPI00369190B3
MSRLVAYLILAVTAGVASFFIGNSTIVNMTAGLSVGLFVPVIDEIGQNWSQIRHVWYSIRYRGKTIRVSTSYLFRIFVDGRYLLIRGSRYAHQFQPVGGVHKVSPQGSSALSVMGVTDDDLIPVDPASYGDVRVRVPGKMITKFFRWFESREGREDSPWREFQEELVATGIVSNSNFPHIIHNYLRREVDAIRYSEYADSLEILVADIYELVPNQDQENELRQLAASGHPDLVWVSAQQIRRRGATPGQPQTIEIAAHARRVI